MTGQARDLWVFGYGSLMWRPGFPFEERHKAVLRGYHRALCIYSHVHRGTPEKPGLVMGLDRGGSCLGVAFRVAHAHAAETVGYLRQREQVTSVYVERVLPVTLADGRRQLALAYAVDRHHPQYAGRLDDEALLRFVRQGVGQSGANPDYVRQTHQQLAELGVTDPLLARITHHLG